MLPLKSQHAGKAIWDCLVKEAKQTLSTKVWSGNTPTTLSQHMNMNRTAWITLNECAEHILVDVPSDCARVTYLIDSLKTIDPTVLAAIMVVFQDEPDKRVNFENMFTYLVPVCPVEAKTAKKIGKVSFEASALGTAGKLQMQGGLRGGNKKCYHHHEEFHALSKEQKDELCEWTKANGGKKAGGKKPASPKKSDERWSTKRFKSLISELEACQTKMFKAIAKEQ